MQFQERNVESNTAADDSAEASADWAARFPAQADCSEARFHHVGVKLRVPRHVLGRCAGTDGHLLFDSESIKVTKETKISFAVLFKSSKSSKNGYKTRDYKDRYRRNVAVALLKLLQPHRTTYITSWQVAFVKLALIGAPIHWARILWKITRQHAFEEKGGSINHLSPFLINFYWSMGCLIATKRVQFPLLSRSNPGQYVKDGEVDTDEEETPASTPPTQPRVEGESLAARVPRKRR
ncbi:hypothetical protein AXG93_248s1000 [Marchantia polymorpha subsp. ruderalis]|uniref:Uncharacterized protein n=1 Tax=Marchantia polymorpha subsp. ruderalis TaxID=1480154 RepID=A0A176WN55_MARPO|nr:hypothetical protein AXG93_248s1000 [Marchantia polymorpha subsp. ruderalis]